LPSFSRFARLAFALPAIAIFLGGCSSDGFYRQSIAGQAELLRSRQAFDAALADPTTHDLLRRQLELVTDIVAFATDRLALPDNGSYRSFVVVDRPFVVWNVVAAPPLSLTPVSWCFPIVGCVAYRGYFDETDAVAFADGLRAEGLDVTIAGARAYSTLGFFKDPVPTTILFDADYALAATIIHELAHQRVYIEDDTTFNESYAGAVERAGLELWLDEFGTAEMRAQYRRDDARYRDFIELVLGARAELGALYASALPDAELLAEKEAIFDRLRADYRRIKSSWGGYSGYDRWFAEDLNNAKLALVASYNNYVEAFMSLLIDSGGDWGTFHARVEAISELPAEERRAILDGLWEH
jgi:predicted aminopeptidase